MILACSTAFAGPQGGDFEIVSSTIDGGGGTSTGGDYVLTGTIGQHDASVVDSTGGVFQLAGGFWARVREITELIFSDSFEAPTDE